MTSAARSNGSTGKDPAVNGINFLQDTIAKYPLLKKAEEADLAKRIQRGDMAAKERFILSNVRLVLSETRRFYYRRGSLSMDDLAQEGMFGLIRAVEKFDHTRGFKFSSYAIHWINQAIERGINRTSEIVRMPVNIDAANRKVAGVTSALVTESGLQPSDEAIAERAEMSVTEVQTARSARKRMLSLDKSHSEDDEGFNFLSRLKADDRDPVDEVQDSELVRLVARALECLSRREREIIGMRFGLDGTEALSLREVGIRLKLDIERVRMLEARALKRLRGEPDLVATA